MERHVRPILVIMAAGTVAMLIAPALWETLGPGDRERWKERTPPIAALQAAAQAVQTGSVVFIDVREPQEFDEFHIPGAVSIPLYRLHDADLEFVRGADVVVAYCLKDFRGWEGARILLDRGVPNVRVLQGFGTGAWKKDDLPLAGRMTGLSDQQALELMDAKFREAPR
jgi:rhodanese-related sulfurtransferase